MKRRDSGQRPPIPRWILDRDSDEGQQAAYRWAEANGYTKIEVLIGQRDAHHARLGVDRDGDGAA